ncbi:MAG: hypothetical protein ABSC94_15105 [Polyangiaceae bacterium]
MPDELPVDVEADVTVGDEVEDDDIDGELVAALPVEDDPVSNVSLPPSPISWDASSPEQAARFAITTVAKAAEPRTIDPCWLIPAPVDLGYESSVTLKTLVHRECP